MLAQIVTENGQKKIKPLTADVGAGLPVGTWCSFENDVAPNANWIRAGTTFDASAYPVLASYLGTNVVPNKGTGLDWDNAETITLSTSDYEVTKSGWITCFARTATSGTALYLRVNGVRVAYGSYGNNIALYVNAQVEVKAGDKINFEGTVSFQDTHFVPYLHPLFIKATSGLSENQQDSVINALNVSRSYSTEETLTGKTWIDGKPIYRKVYTELAIKNTNTIVDTLTDIDKLLSARGLITSYTSSSQTTPAYYITTDGSANGSWFIQIDTSKQLRANSLHDTLRITDIIIEYTKTTD